MWADLILRGMIGVVLLLSFNDSVNMLSERPPAPSDDEIRLYGLKNIIERNRERINSFALDPIRVYRHQSRSQLFIDLSAWNEQQKYSAGKYNFGGSKSMVSYSKSVKVYFDCKSRQDAYCYAVDVNNYAGQYVSDAKSGICSNEMLDEIRSIGVDSVAFYISGIKKPIATCTNGFWLIDSRDG
ncbi:hypothetical protein QO259_12280 [Salinicola sp. JS01]|uniref:hypothetical protein n=1 Tax=Salinicola sp. JS01 TaxID=3050071 RepID=UPI00255C043E|nr:hypothetical protein [Salinicola sp. JS01]WIX31594.1 hypothetical protein QO259_12280 [Salinicola sp. JS01]